MLIWVHYWFHRINYWSQLKHQAQKANVLRWTTECWLSGLLPALRSSWTICWWPQRDALCKGVSPIDPRSCRESCLINFYSNGHWHKSVIEQHASTWVTKAAREKWVQMVRLENELHSLTWWPCFHLDKLNFSLNSWWEEVLASWNLGTKANSNVRLIINRLPQSWTSFHPTHS